MYYNMLCKMFTAIFSLFYFWRNSKDVYGDPHLSQSRLKLLPYSVGQMSVIIVDKLMIIAGHLVMVVLIKGYWKNLISDGQCSSSCRLKMEKKPMTLSCACNLLLHYQQMGQLTDNLFITCSYSLP